MLQENNENIKDDQRRYTLPSLSSQQAMRFPPFHLIHHQPPPRPFVSFFHTTPFSMSIPHIQCHVVDMKLHPC